MKKILLPLAFLFILSNLFAQIDQREVVVTNIIVPVRVMDGNRFVDNLALEDFELFEDGKLQKIEALYLVNKTNIEREEALKRYNPSLSRHFYLLFYLTDYHPKFAEASDYLFNHVLLPGDTLTIMTPMDTYNLSQRALETRPKERLSKELQNILRKDTQMGAANYRSLMTELKRLVRAISASGQEVRVISGLETESTTSMFDLENLLMRYGENMEKMEELRFVDEKKFIQFAANVKRLTGPKNVFFFYQREFRPEINQTVLTRLTSLHQDQPEILAQVQNLFQLYQRRPTFDQRKIIAAFADASVSFNFIFMQKDPELVSGITMREQSEDIFGAFTQAAKATGGVIDSSQNPAAAFRNASDLSKSYYLLYYSPLDYKKDGKFKSIIVRVKDKVYNITHRVGYFAN